jgi:hypothetical protein
MSDRLLDNRIVPGESLQPIFRLSSKHIAGRTASLNQEIPSKSLSGRIVGGSP